ncbi:CCL3 protein, partial [Penelope pileata]|nr:CCL3 protein [Penelope pileata]
LCFSAPTEGVPTSCCISYVRRPIPRNRIATVYTTSSSCANPGVILVTKKGMEACADPKETWVQARLKEFQSREN